MAYADGNLDTPCAFLTVDAAADDLYKVGLIYSTGSHMPADYVSAHKWFNLAALRGSEEAKALRKELSEHMSKDEIALAQKAAREWLQLAN